MQVESTALPFVLLGECHHCCGLFVELALYIKNPTGTLSMYGRMVSLSSCRLGLWLHMVRRLDLLWVHPMGRYIVAINIGLDLLAFALY